MKKKYIAENHTKGLKRGALILAAALILGGCGGQSKSSESEAVTEATEAQTEASEKETGEESAKAEESEKEAEASEENTAAEAVSENAEESQEAEAESQEESAEEIKAAEADAQAGEAAPQAIYQAIGEAVTLPSMMEGDDSFISNYYGINPADLDGYVFASAEDATLADSIIIMKAKSPDAVEHVVASLNTVIEQKAAEMENYLPEQYEIVAKSSVKTEGSYVYLVISNDADSIEAVIQSALQ